MAKKKKKLNLKKVSIFIICIILIIVLIINHPKKVSTKIEKKQEDKIIVKEEEKSITLAMVGDALINDYLYKDANRVANYNGYDFKPYLKLIKEKIKDYDLAYYNQETILGGTSIGLSSYPAFNSPYEIGDAMIDSGFNIVSLATNHTLDRGEKAIVLSREYWNKQTNVYSVGSYSSYQKKTDIENKIYEKNGIKYAILNYTYGTNGIPIPENKYYLVNVWENNNDNYKQTVINDLKRLREKVDVLMVAMHWGIEYTHTPTSLQKDTAKFLSDNGVDIIIGTHPHVIEPLEFINNTLVIYSLGNFISSQTSDSCINYKCSVGLLTSLKITKEDNIIKIDNIENELIYTYHNNYKDYLVIPFSSNEIKNHLSNYKNVYNTYSKIISSTDERIKTVPLVK